MAERADERSTLQRLRRALFHLTLLGLVAAWVFLTGYYTLRPGESAVILRFGKWQRTVHAEGPHLNAPWPIETRVSIESNRELRMEFGDVDDAERRDETAMQTRDNNIVYLAFTVLYRRAMPFEYLYRVRDPELMLREASQAAMREVVGRNTVDGVLRERRELVETEVRDRLQQISDTYQLGIAISDVDLQEVQPPQAVRAAFDDVVNANQDRNRKINNAQGYANEVVPRARAEAAEKLATAGAYRIAKVAQAQGDTQRFGALLVEYERAPDITRKRLYFETMEQVLPDVEKVIIERGAAQVLPYFPIGAQRALPAPTPPASARENKRENKRESAAPEAPPAKTAPREERTP